MSNGINVNPLNAITQVYLDQIANAKAKETQKDIERWTQEEGYQRDPEGQEKDRKRSKQTDPSKDNFTGIGDSIADIMKQNAAMKKAAAKKKVSEEKKAKRWQDDDGDGKWYEKSDKNVVFYSHPNSQELIGYVHFFPPATEIWFRNPHVRYYVELINQQGKKESWDVRTSSPSLLVRKGWTKETIKVGDEISIFGHPGRDGRKLLSVISIKLPNGSSLGKKYPD